MKKTMNILGQVACVIWPNSTDIPPTILNTVLVKPASGLALMAKHKENSAEKQAEMGALIDKLQDISDPKGGVSIEDQGGFWLGYYHYAAGQKAAKNYGHRELRLAGETLFGERWQTDLTRALGLSDSRRIRQWLSGDRSIPVGIWTDILVLLRQKQTSIESVVRKLEK